VEKEKVVAKKNQKGPRLHALSILKIFII